MTEEEINNKSSFLIQCKKTYFSGIRPAAPNRFDKEDYLKLVEIARLYFENNLMENFANYLVEGQYFVQLWAAHLILEHGQANEKIKNWCIEEIKKYSNSKLSPDVAIQEQNWLDTYLKLNQTN